MYIPLPILVISVALILVLLLVRSGRRSSRHLLEAPPLMDLPGDVESDARTLVLEGSKLAAIKLVRERSGLGLKEAKELVERMQVQP